MQIVFHNRDLHLSLLDLFYSFVVRKILLFSFQIIPFLNDHFSSFLLNWHSDIRW